MRIKLFSISVAGDEEGEEALNRFMAGNRVLELRQELVNAPGGAYWSFCVRYLGRATSSSVSNKKTERIDYKEVLDEKVFAIFSDLRVCRKELAREAAIPVYAVFTNAELAKMAGLEEMTMEAMKTISGIGEAKASKYGLEIIERYNKMKTDEASR